MAESTRACLAAVAAQIGTRRGELAGIGITGQQHGTVVVDERLVPLTPFINWQDRRGDELMTGSTRSYIQEAVARAGADAPQRTGCRLSCLAGCGSGSRSSGRWRWRRTCC